MRRLLAWGFACFMVALGRPALGADLVPQKLNVQGVLRNVAGEVVTGNYSIRFRLYDSESGPTILYEETRAVTVTGGFFNVVLGPLGNVFKDRSQVWLGIRLGTDAELPRQPVTSVGFAYQAEHAETADELTAPATDITCTKCVELGALADFPWAQSTGAPGGPARDLSCTGCVLTGAIQDGAVTDAKITGPISASKLPTASESALGVMRVGAGLTVSAGLVSARFGTGAGDVAVGNHTHQGIGQSDLTLYYGYKMIFDDGADNDFARLLQPTPPNDNNIAVRLWLGDDWDESERFEIYSETPTFTGVTHRFAANGNAYHKGNLQVDGSLVCSSCVGNEDLAAGIDGAKLQNGTVTAAKLAPDAMVGYMSQYKDKDDLNWWADPNGTSEMRDLRVNLVIDRNNTQYRFNGDETSYLMELGLGPVSGGNAQIVLNGANVLQVCGPNRGCSVASDIVAGKLRLSADGSFANAYGCDPGMGGICGTVMYDRNNTAFWVDPNGHTGLNRAWVTPRADYYSWTGADLHTRSMEIVSNVSGSGGDPWLTFHHWGYGGPRLRFYGPEARLYLEDAHGNYTNYFWVNGMHIRAQGYYVESYSSEGTGRYLRLGDAWGKPGVYSDYDLYLNSERLVIINDNNQSNWIFDGSTLYRNAWAQIYNTGSNFHIDAYNGGLYLNWNTGNITYVGGAGLRVRGTAWGGPWGANPTIYANEDNHGGGGIAVSDDGGFFDFNDGWTQYRGSYGLHMTGRAIIDRGCTPGWSRLGQKCIYGYWSCQRQGESAYWCEAATRGHSCTEEDISAIRAWWGWFGPGGMHYNQSIHDNGSQHYNCACGWYGWYDHDGDNCKCDCRPWYCCLNVDG